MKTGALVVCLAFLLLTAFAKDVKDLKDIKYPVSAIPEALKKNVNVVVREDETIFKIESKKRSSVHFHYAATIFNSNAQGFARKAVYYDKKTKVRDLKAYVYDSNGDLIKRLKTADIIDRSAADGMSLFTDDRYKYFDLAQPSFPYTVEFEYDLDYDFLYGIDGSVAVGEEKLSVEHFTYQLIYPLDLKPRFKTFNINEKPVVAKLNDNIESITWKLDNIAPIQMEPLAATEDFVKLIKAAPATFEYDGYGGNMSNWEALGQWQKELNEGRDVLPEETKKKVKELTAGLKTNEEKAKVLYEYMQSKTRYVSIQLGIGGWQPFDALTVDKTGYGDCKALSNYMVALLKEAGVKAYYSKIYAGVGQTGIDPSFPSTTSNHIIVALPNEKDTTWLECTSQSSPFGYIGRFTDNRYAIMVTENGGKLVKTTYYPPNINIQSRTAEVDLDAAGNAKAKVTTRFSGLQYENGGLDNIVGGSADDQKKWIQNNTEIPTFVINDFTITEKKSKVPTATVKMNLTLAKYASVSNKRIFMTPNLMNRSSYIPEKVEARKSPFVLKMGYTDIDTIRYHIPESIYPEFLPADTKVTSRFGTYEAGFKLDQGSLIYIRKMTRKDGEYPAEAYQELIDFYKSINKADNTKLVFLVKT